MIYCPSCGAELEAGCLVCPVCDAEIDSQAFMAPDEDKTSFIDDEIDFGGTAVQDPRNDSLTVIARDDLFASKVDTTLYTPMEDLLGTPPADDVEPIEDEGEAGRLKPEQAGDAGPGPGSGSDGRKGIAAALAVAVAVVAVVAIVLAIVKPWDTGVEDTNVIAQGETEEIASEAESGESEGEEMETVQLTVVGSDGSTQVVDIRRHKSEERVLPDSGERIYSADELADLTDAERCIAWNEIIAAANGYAFKNPALAGYFDGCSWYAANPSAGASENLTSEGSANIDTLQSMTDDWWKHLPTA